MKILMIISLVAAISACTFVPLDNRRQEGFVANGYSEAISRILATAVEYDSANRTLILRTENGRRLIVDTEGYIKNLKLNSEASYTIANYLDEKTGSKGLILREIAEAGVGVIYDASICSVHGLHMKRVSRTYMMNDHEFSESEILELERHPNDGIFRDFQAGYASQRMLAGWRCDKCVEHSRNRPQ